MRSDIIKTDRSSKIDMSAVQRARELQILEQHRQRLNEFVQQHKSGNLNIEEEYYAAVLLQQRSRSLATNLQITLIDCEYYIFD